MLATHAGTAHAGAWVPEPGHFYLELRGLFVTATQGFSPDGGRRQLKAGSSLTLSGAPGGATPARLRDGAALVYGEIGLATRLAVVVDFTLVRSVTVERQDTRALSSVGVGDLHAGLRLVLLDEEVSCAIEAKLGIPTGRSDGEVPLGTGDLRGELTLHLGHVWERVPFFVQVALGAELRGSGTQRVESPSFMSSVHDVNVDYASELVYAAEVGYLARIGERVRLSPSIRVDGVYGTRKPTTDEPASLEVDPIAPASMRYLRLTAQLAAEIRPSPKKPGAVVVGLGGGAFVWGQGLPAEGQVTLALGYKR
ncbi:MAG: hypothetical protein ABI321_04245 [Polyangia bacterium]